MRPNGTKMPQDGAKMRQESTKMPQDGAKMGQDGTKMGQDGAKVAKTLKIDDSTALFKRFLDFCSAPEGSRGRVSRVYARRGTIVKP